MEARNSFASRKTIRAFEPYQRWSHRHFKTRTENSMTNFLTVILLTASLSGFANAQNAPSASAPNPGADPAAIQPRRGDTVTTKIAPGSVLPAVLAKTVDAKKAKVGDEVVAKITEDMKSNGGAVIIAKDTKIMGRVTVAQARSKEQKESQLAIAFERAVPPSGSEMPLPMSIQAVISFKNDREQGEGNEAGEGARPAGGSTPAGARAGSATPPAPGSAGGDSDEHKTSNSRPVITGQTQGVIGIPNLTLAPAASPAQGSLLTSEKNNVKIEGGTLMLLRVN
jgi:hypothetical protein